MAIVGMVFGQSVIPSAPMLLVARRTSVLTMDPDRRDVADGAVLVDGDRIVAVGPAAELAAAAPDAERLGGPGPPRPARV